ncbi:helix-turn-helix transcriptional regulator [Vagococcus fluvialis]|uniref:helix-turn-helix transcriptional regulator n=1 Tax=Vagococcus fluvialis TaxID=2738 RepID=UPI0037B0CA42
MDYTEDIQKSLTYIEDNLYEDISLEKIAEHVGLSKFHFQRVFKKVLNSGVYKYIQKRRISNASLLLLNSELKIIDIAIISGFSSQEAFSRTFKLYYHLSPYQFRQQFKNLFRRDLAMDKTKIKGWLISGNNFDKYEVAIDNKYFHSGMRSVKISREDSLYTEDFATVMQQVSAKNYINKRVRVSAYLKSKDIDGWGGIWFRVDGKEYKQLKFDNMQNRPVVGTNDWNYYASVLNIDKEAEVLNFGFLLQGEGELWADDFCLEVVPETIPTTDFEKFDSYPEEPQNLSFSD